MTTVDELRSNLSSQVLLFHGGVGGKRLLLCHLGAGGDNVASVTSELSKLRPVSSQMGLSPVLLEKPCDPRWEVIFIEETQVHSLPSE